MPRVPNIESDWFFLQPKFEREYIHKQILINLSSEKRQRVGKGERGGGEVKRERKRHTCTHTKRWRELGMNLSLYVHTHIHTRTSMCVMNLQRVYRPKLGLCPPGQWLDPAVYKCKSINLACEWSQFWLDDHTAKAEGAAATTRFEAAPLVTQPQQSSTACDTTTTFWSKHWQAIC